jgi:hypothetical protein
MGSFISWIKTNIPEGNDESIGEAREENEPQSLSGQSPTNLVHSCIHYETSLG